MFVDENAIEEGSMVEITVENIEMEAEEEDGDLDVDQQKSMVRGDEEEKLEITYDEDENSIPTESASSRGRVRQPKKRRPKFPNSVSQEFQNKAEILSDVFSRTTPVINHDAIRASYEAHFAYLGMIMPKITHVPNIEIGFEVYGNQPKNLIYKLFISRLRAENTFHHDDFWRGESVPVQYMNNHHARQLALINECVRYVRESSYRTRATHPKLRDSKILYNRGYSVPLQVLGASIVTEVVKKYRKNEFMTEATTAFSLLMPAVQAGLWYSWFTTEGLFYCTAPNLSLLDNVLHNKDGYSMWWPESGVGYFSVRGVRVPRQVVKSPDVITIEDIRNQRNTEVRRLMIEVYGHDRFLKESGAILVHEDETGKLWRTPTVPRPNQPKAIPHPRQKAVTSEMSREERIAVKMQNSKLLIEREELVREVRTKHEAELRRWRRLNDERFSFVEVINSTPEPDGTYKVYFISVPDTMQRARQAVAWTFQLEEDQYHPVVQT